ncbi:hypothetical protein M959_04720, partial [Chaetura pelagica]
LSDTKIVKIPTGVKGPLLIAGQNCGALLLGHSSATMKGLTVAPGVIDADYAGEIMIMASTSFPPLFIPAGSSIAQLVPLPQLVQEAAGPVRGSAGFGSTGGLALLTLTMDQHPLVHATLQQGAKQIQLQALLDTGADITIVS